MVQKEQKIKSRKGSVLSHADWIRSQSEYEEKNEEEISKISSVNDLLEQPLQNETSEDKIMHDKVGQSDFENSEDQIMQEDDLDYSSVWGRFWSLRERNTGERRGEQKDPENERPVRGIKPIRFMGCDTGKLISLICIRVREIWYKPLSENNCRVW